MKQFVHCHHRKTPGSLREPFDFAQGRVWGTLIPVISCE
jgi:hypothetical protein